MLEFFIFFLLFIVPGFVALFVYDLLSCHKLMTCCRAIAGALVFNLLIMLINFIGLYHFKEIWDIGKLKWYFECLSFTPKYGILSIAVGIILAVIAALITRHPFCKNCCKKYYE
jgi:ABC-type sugar transport system permease subunit